MSKLADAIRRAVRPAARPIGFASVAAERTASMLILARLSSAKGAEAPSAADAIITTGVTAPSGQQNGASPALWGVDTQLADRAAAKALHESGADFLVFDDDAAPASLLLEDDLGFVMRISLDASETYLRGVEGLPLDALLVPAVEGALTVRRTLDLRRLTAITRKPLLIPVAPDASAAELETLRDCGVVGLLIGADGVATLRPTVDGLAPRKRAKENRSTPVLVPSTAVAGNRDGDDEDDE